MLLNRRQMLTATAALTAGSAMRVTAAAEVPPSADAAPAAIPVTARIVDFARSLTFEQLPSEVVAAAKRYVLDGLGCGVAGIHTEKGRLAVGLVTSLGGTPEARVLGTTARLSATGAAFANAELINALDFDAVPHIPPIAIPSVLAVAEKMRASGRQFITALVVAHEIAARLWKASSQMSATVAQTGRTPEVFAINQESIIACAAGIANLLALTETQTAHTMGLAGYYCPPQASHYWETGTPKSMVKYTPVGWVSQGAVTAALLAQAGFTAATDILDDEGFAKFYGLRNWRPEGAIDALGSDWRILSMNYKPHACCGFLHSQIDCMVELVREHGLEPGEIESIHSLSMPFVANPDQMNVRTQEDAQFSIPYMLAVAAHGLPTDATCQLPERLNDPAIRATMKKITWGTHPEAAATKRANPQSFLARVEVRARGRSFVKERLYAKGGAALPMSDAELEEKFVRNVAGVLTSAAASRAGELIDALEKLEDVSELSSALSG